MFVTVYFISYAYRQYDNIVSITPHELGVVLTDSGGNSEILYFCDIRKIVISKGVFLYD